MWEVFFSMAILLVLVGGLVWAIRRFQVERTHQPRMEFDIDCSFLRPQLGNYAFQVVVKAKNRGLIRHEFRQLNLRIRGLLKGAELRPWAGHEPRLEFPVVTAKGDRLYPPKYDFIFVEPGVEQVMTYATPVSAGTSQPVTHDGPIIISGTSSAELDGNWLRLTSPTDLLVGLRSVGGLLLPYRLKCNWPPARNPCDLSNRPSSCC